MLLIPLLVHLHDVSIQSKLLGNLLSFSQNLQILHFLLNLCQVGFHLVLCFLDDERLVSLSCLLLGLKLLLSFSCLLINNLILLALDHGQLLVDILLPQLQDLLPPVASIGEFLRDLNRGDGGAGGGLAGRPKNFISLFMENENNQE